ncbi:MAG: bifunctional UDP-3-O-[3-hydroxymyristoyl] N-acetylglucosamine deacetylase/3-hydroxyacyl-ACP dehydratase [Cryomorphaceae bacterium]|nr:bifunctional UDP-3-O-[3-hydroxymyristoyl] N-acetylglucosamine deacetylase/3-hydroxyacyl-ACP dehydratase [Cryomorphaceae bacterium]
MTQNILQSSFQLSGKGIHTGVPCTVTVHPGAPGSGYVFTRMDCPEATPMKLTPDSVTDTDRRTTLSNGTTTVHTAEHLLSALYAAKIYDVDVHLTAGEVPILDGSAAPWWDAIHAAGIAQSTVIPHGITLYHPIRVEDPETGAWAEAIPAALPSFEVKLSHEEAAVGPLSAFYHLKDDYGNTIAPARTFTLASHITPLIHRGLLKGAEPGSGVIVIDAPLKDEDWKALEVFVGLPSERSEDTDGLPLTTFRMPNEPASHKLLDLMGDIALLGTPVRAHIRTFKPGHKTNTLLSKKIMEEAKTKGIPTYNPNQEPLMDIKKIMSILPHRPPFLFVDKILDMTEGEIVGMKAVTMNEPFFTGHFPGAPVMPGVLQLEAMAQVGGILALSSVPDPENYLTYFLKMDQVKFKNKVGPGDTLIFHLQLTEPIRRGIVQMRGQAWVGDKLASEGHFTALITKDK